jgi:hypothetical protein
MITVKEEIELQEQLKADVYSQVAAKTTVG